MTAKFYKYEDKHALVGDGIRYVEANDDGIAIREISVSGEIILASNIKYPGCGILLSECECDYDEIPEVEKIDKTEFERLWSLHLKNNAGRWAYTKAAYNVGAKVIGHIEMFLPQGTIIDLGNAVLGVADTADCKTSTVPENMYSGNLITAVVAGYDEQYQWLILQSPQVYSQRREFQW
jgi:hypothetical protein